LVHPETFGGLLIIATYMNKPTMYPSPSCAFVGSNDVFATLPAIRIVPGLTPPIVDPVGSVTLSPELEIDASPIMMVFGLTIKSRVYTARKRRSALPRSYVFVARGMMLSCNNPVKLPVAP
jgi:hypothetical protein